MLVLTVWAMISNEIGFVMQEVTAEYPAYQKWTLVAVNGLTLVLALVMAVEVFMNLARPRKCELKA